MAAFLGLGLIIGIAAGVAILYLYGMFYGFRRGCPFCAEQLDRTLPDEE